MQARCVVCIALTSELAGIECVVSRMRRAQNGIRDSKSIACINTKIPSFSSARLISQRNRMSASLQLSNLDYGRLQLDGCACMPSGLLFGWTDRHTGFSCLLGSILLIDFETSWAFHAMHAFLPFHRDMLSNKDLERPPV